MLERVVVTDSRSSSTLTCLGVPFLDSCTPYTTRLRLESGRGTGVGCVDGCRCCGLIGFSCRDDAV